MLLACLALLLAAWPDPGPVLPDTAHVALAEHSRFFWGVALYRRQKMAGLTPT